MRFSPVLYILLAAINYVYRGASSYHYTEECAEQIVIIDTQTEPDNERKKVGVVGRSYNLVICKLRQSTINTSVVDNLQFYVFWYKMLNNSAWNQDNVLKL